MGALAADAGLAAKIERMGLYALEASGEVLVGRREPEKLLLVELGRDVHRVLTRQTIDDQQGLDKNAVKRVILCSGKIYWDLLAESEKRGTRDTAIVRVEQLYPTPVDEIKATYAQYPNAELVWVQDEPANQGPWTYIGLFLPKYMDGKVAKLVSRPASASPATGSSKAHAAEQADLVQRAFDA